MKSKKNKELIELSREKRAEMVAQLSEIAQKMLTKELHYKIGVAATGAYKVVAQVLAIELGHQKLELDKNKQDDILEIEVGSK